MSDSYTLLGVLLTFLCIGGFIAVVGVGIVFVMIRSGKAANRGWADLASRLGLTLIKPTGLFGSPQIKGMFRQRAIHLFIYDAGSQGNRSIHTAAALTVSNPVDAAFEITPAGVIGNFLVKMTAAQDVELGSPAFDERFVIRSNPPELAVKALGEAGLQAAIMGVPGTFRIELQGPSLAFSQAGTQTNTDFLTRMFGTLSDIADRIEA